jgi:hypothetical protein
MTGMAVLGSLCAMAGAAFLGVGDAAFAGTQNQSAASAFLLGGAVLILAFVAWIPARLVRVVAGLALLGAAWGELSAIGGFALPAALFTAISGVLTLCMKSEPRRSAHAA